MVRKNNKWNISKEKGEELAHQYIIEILSESRNQTLTLSELIILLNQRTKYHKISQHSKKKSLSIFLKSHYGSILEFFDKFSMYGVMKHGSEISIKLFDTELKYNSGTKDIFKHHEGWTFVDEEEFLII